MAPVTTRRSFRVRAVQTSPDGIQFVRGRLSGLTPQDAHLLEASLKDFNLAAQLGMFAISAAAAMQLRVAHSSSGTLELTIDALSQHLSMLRILANLMRSCIEKNDGEPVELNLKCYRKDSEEYLSSPTTLLEVDSVAYLTSYDSLPFRVDLISPLSGGDRVVRIFFKCDLDDQQFDLYRNRCRFWDKLLLAGAYTDDLSARCPFVQDELETYLLAPNVIEHVVLELRQSYSCFYGLCATLQGPTLADLLVERVEVD